jgi:hypothetical protein
MREAMLPLPQYVFMGWCLVKHRDNFTFTFCKIYDLHYLFCQLPTQKAVLLYPSELHEKFLLYLYTLIFYILQIYNLS